MLSSSMPNILSNHQSKPKTNLSASLRNLDVSLESLLTCEDKDTDDSRSDQSASSNTAVAGSAPPRITQSNSLSDNVTNYSSYGEAQVRRSLPLYSSYKHGMTGRERSQHSKQHESQGHRILAVSSSTKDNLTKNNMNMLSSYRMIEKVKDAKKGKRSSKAKFDKNGRCTRHPHIVVASKRPFANGWNMILDCCPTCAEESNRKAVARAA